MTVAIYIEDDGTVEAHYNNEIIWMKDEGGFDSELAVSERIRALVGGYYRGGEAKRSRTRNVMQLNEYLDRAGQLSPEHDADLEPGELLLSDGDDE